jgi:hypothetical protein
MKYLLIFIFVFLLFRYISYVLASRANKTQQFGNKTSTDTTNSTRQQGRFSKAVDAEFEVIEEEETKKK